MSAYNTLSISVKCLYCRNTYQSNLQFKAGEVWQHHYHINDFIVDAKENSIAQRKIMAYGILEDDICPNCKNVNPEDYEILIEYGVIKDYKILENISRYIHPNDSNFYIIEGNKDM